MIGTRKLNPKAYIGAVPYNPPPKVSGPPRYKTAIACWGLLALWVAGPLFNRGGDDWWIGLPSVAVFAAILLPVGWLAWRGRWGT
jgi:hypothetical protein